MRKKKGGKVKSRSHRLYFSIGVPIVGWTSGSSGKRMKMKENQTAPSATFEEVMGQTRGGNGLNPATKKKSKKGEPKAIH